jgi:EipB-like
VRSASRRRLAVSGALYGPAAALALGLAVLIVPSGAPAAAVTIAPHRAVYALDLGHARSDSNVTQAEGRLEYEWDDVCDGWTVRQRTLLSMVHRSGQPIQSNWVINSWESKDGLKYRFFVRRFNAGGTVESVRGHAELDGPGLGGRATFNGPVERVIKLPKGTLFPTNYSLEMMAMAEQGRLPVWRIMFDGFGDEDLLGVSAAMVSELAAGESASLKSAMISDQPSWRVRLAFFPLDRRSPEPDREQGFRVFANGIVDELVIDYGDFSIDANLETLASLPVASCQ